MKIERLERRDKNGWSVAMHVLDLGPRGPNGAELLIHSPTWVGDATFERIDALGRPRLIFAPNHFHHLSVRRFRERYPDARVVASAGAIPRLERHGHTGLEKIEDTLLPSKIRWLVPEGTKSGEAWLSVDVEGGAGPTWIVCDAFFHENAPIKGLEGAFLRLAKIAPGLCIGMTFTMMCIADKRRYARSVHDLIDREKPSRVLFSHGEPLEGDVAGALHAVLDARLGKAR